MDVRPEDRLIMKKTTPVEVMKCMLFAPVWILGSVV